MDVLQTVRRTAHRTRIGAAFSALNRLAPSASLYGGTDKLQHGYLPYYERHLGPRRLRRLLVFEIGVGNYSDPSPGGSLRLWRDYLLRSKILGLDIEHKVVELGRRVAFEQVDQSSASDLQRVVEQHGAPDVVIDDGSHVGAHVHASFDVLWPKVRPGGLYVIEDLSTSYYPGHGGGDPAPLGSAVGLLQSLVDGVQANDLTFTRKPTWGQRSAPRHANVAELHVYPGVAFIQKT